MGNFLIAIIAIVAGILGSAFAKILGDEFKAWRPNIVQRLIGIAGSLLSEADRDRYYEEWSAHVEEVPGDLGKLLSGVGFVWAAFRMSDRRYLALGMKRAMDISIAAPALVLLGPPLLIAALAIKIESPDGPIFFTQKRIGKGGKEIRVLKFRTMRVDAAEKLAELLRIDPEATRKLTTDPRITFVGRILRTYSFDELPQLVNVLKGEMSFVGPHPLPTEFAEQDDFEEISKVRHSIRPGLVGLGQMAFLSSNKARLSEMLKADIVYVKTQSLLLDLGILFKSIPKGLFGDATTKRVKIGKVIAGSVTGAICAAMIFTAVSVLWRWLST